MMMLSFDGAGRDPAVYEDPDRFDVTREVNDLMTFGHGPHYCLGAHLARQEIGVMIEAMLEFLPSGSRRREDLTEYQVIGPFKRPDVAADRDRQGLRKTPKRLRGALGAVLAWSTAGHTGAEKLGGWRRR